METKVVIDEDIINANSETSITANGILVSGKKLSTTCDPVYMGFVDKILPIVRERKNIELKQTISASGETITWINILSNSITSEVFNLFKSMGIYMPKLTIGVCEASHTIYTSSKLCRDLRKYSETQCAAILMYMLTLAKFIKRTEELLIDYEYDGLTGMLKTSAKQNELLECFRTFKDTEVWYLKDSNKDDYTVVQFYNTNYTYTNDLYANPDVLKVGIVKHKTGAVAGIASVALGKIHYTFVISDKIAYTDFDLCNIEISADSVCAAIANAFPGTFTLKKTDKLPLSKDMTFLEFDGEGFAEFSKTEKLPNWLYSWVAAMFAKGTATAGIDELEYLTKAYGVEVPAGHTATVSLSFDDMRKMYDTDAYAQELYKQIKPYYSTYALGSDLDTNLKGFSNGALYSMAFIGESGTGKSTAARVIPARCGIPYVSINFSVNIEEADLFGAMTPNPHKSSAEDPEFIWADGIITKAVRNGYCVILEELNFARPGVLGKLNSLLDENRQIDLSTGEIVQAHPNFRIIATCNIAYEGTNRFNKALINRFDDVTIFKDLARNDAITVIKQRTGYTNTAKISKVYDVYEALKKFSEEQNVNTVVSMRQLLNIFTKGKYYSSAKDAVQRIMLNGAFIEDAEYQKVFEDTVFTAFDLKFKI